MDKLEPILKQKFWILLGIGMIMTIAGWWMTTGSLAATITQRKTTLDGVEKVIPTEETPNASWAEQLSQINVRQEALVTIARREMWERQKARMFWPATVDDFAKKIPYHGDFPLAATMLYRDQHIQDADKVWKIARPFNPIDQSGVVLFPFEKFPARKSYGQLTPTSTQMWEDQEDLWLLVPLMEAIRNINGGETGTRQDAVLYVVDKLLLTGGDRSTIGQSGGSSSGGGISLGGGESDGGADSPMMLGGLGGLSGGAGGAAGNAPPTSADFDIKEEYGNPGGAGGGGGGNVMMEMSLGADAGDGGGGVASVRAVARRYVDDAENLPYKTRAFYLSVVMDHRKVPLFLAELTANGSSDWPIEIGRVQMVRLNPDEGLSPARGGGGLASGFGGSTFGNPPMPTGAAFGAADGETSESEGIGGSLPFGGVPLGVGRGPTASFDAVFADPNLARVALCGLIYIYREVKEADLPPPVETPSPGNDGSTPVAEGTVPADPAAAPATGETPATDPNAPPAAAEPAPAAAEPPAASDNPAPATPAVPALP